RSTSTVTAGYGTTLRSTGSVAWSRNPAMLTPGSRPGCDGTAMSHRLAAARNSSAEDIAPPYERPIHGWRRDIHPGRNPRTRHDTGGSPVPDRPQATAAETSADRCTVSPSEPG